MNLIPQHLNLKQFKIGFGPMSLEIVEILLEISKEQNYNFMMICSRNQVDYNDGYVLKTNELSKLLSSQSSILLCRDHCGPNYKDSDRRLKPELALDQCKKTIDCDIENGFKIIHIDVSRVSFRQKEVAEELISYCISKDPNIILEFGSEENNGSNLDDCFNRLEEQLNFAQSFKNIKFFVTQTGSLIKDRQTGNFNITVNSEIAKRIHQHGLLFKEHNADYLDEADIDLRKTAGVDALNIAPQLGALQTKILYTLGYNTKAWIDFANLVHNGQKYHRWLTEDKKNDKLAAVLVSGHYFFNSIEYERLLKSISQDQFLINLKNKLLRIVTTYNTL